MYGKCTIKDVGISSRLVIVLGNSMKDRLNNSLMDKFAKQNNTLN